MQAYFQPRAAADLLLNSLRLYRGQAATLLLVAALPTFIAELMFNQAFESGWIIGISLAAVGLILEVFSTAAAIVLTCKHAIGDDTRLRAVIRATCRTRLSALFLTFLALAAVVAGGFAILIVPGIIFYAWLLLAPTAVVIEASGVNDAFRRSRELGRGFYARNLALVVAAFWLPLILLNILLAALSLDDNVGGGIAYSAISALLSPFETILTALIYFDMRARKEGLDAARLAEELVPAGT